MAFYGIYTLKIVCITKKVCTEKVYVPKKSVIDQVHSQYEEKIHVGCSMVPLEKLTFIAECTLYPG